MPKSGASFKPGQSGNPAGRPRKKLSQVLAAVAAKADDDYSERLATALFEFATTGKVTLGATTLHAENVREWFDAVKWIYEHIDGKHPVKTDTDITINVEYAPTPVPELPEPE